MRDITPVRISKLTGKPVQSRFYANTGGAGAPTKYKPEYAKMFRDYFEQPLTETVFKTITTKSGTVIEEPVERAKGLVFIEDFAEKIGVTYKCLWEWAEKYPEFGKVYARVKELQKQRLVNNGLAGLYNAQAMIFVAKNFTDMKDKVDIDLQQDIHIDVIGYDPDAVVKPKRERLPGSKHKSLAKGRSK